jgi:hypothetical protein
MFHMNLKYFHFLESMKLKNFTMKVELGLRGAMHHH